MLANQSHSDDEWIKLTTAINPEQAPIFMILEPIINFGPYPRLACKYGTDQ